MANNTIFSRIVIWSETKTDWGTITDVLLKGEMGFEFPDSVAEDTVAVPKIKIGDGVHTFAELPYATLTPDEVNSKINEIVVAQGAHTHTNKEIIDRITAAFTTELKAKYDSVAEEAVRKISIGGVEQEMAEDGSVNLPSYPTVESLGLDKIENTPDAEKQVATAEKIATERKIALKGEVTGEVMFDGSKDVEMQVTIPSVSADKITGTISIDNLPKGALERCVVVANDKARFALTVEDVQLGDTVKVTESGIMYFVKDETKLSSEDGYEVYTAGAASSIDWSGVQNKPTKFIPEAHTHSINDITDYVPPTVDKELDASSTNAVENKAIATKFEEIDAKLADLLYEAIAISSFTNNVNTVEMGRTITDVTLTWKTNKKPVSLTLDGEAVDVASTSKALKGQAIKSNKTFTLKATDDRKAVATKTTAITFYNGIYYGVGGDITVDSAFILGLTRKLQGSKGTSFTVNAGAGQYIYYAVPTRYGTCAFNVGGFDGGFVKHTTINFTNASGYKESYDVYRSTNASLGSTTVKVS